MTYFFQSPVNSEAFAYSRQMPVQTALTISSECLRKPFKVRCQNHRNYCPILQMQTPRYFSPLSVARQKAHIVGTKGKGSLLKASKLQTVYSTNTNTETGFIRDHMQSTFKMVVQHDQLCD